MGAIPIPEEAALTQQAPAVTEKSDTSDQMDQVEHSILILDTSVLNKRRRDVLQVSNSTEYMLAVCEYVTRCNRVCERIWMEVTGALDKRVMHLKRKAGDSNTNTDTS